MQSIDRRTLLKLGTLAAARAILPPLPSLDHYTDGLDERPATTRPLIGFARALRRGGVIRSEPNTKAKPVGTLDADTVLPVYAQIDSDSGSSYNKVWYEVPDGYVHSALVHIVDWQFNEPVMTAGDKGFWAELTVPFADPRTGPSRSAGRSRYRYYGGTVYKVFKVVQSADDSIRETWYQIEDESFPGAYFVPGRYMRVIQAEEFKPLSPQVNPDDKKIVVNLKEQRLYAFERDEMVFTCRTATGATFAAGDFRTPPGKFFVFRKTPSQHMYGGAVGDEGSFDLPGIPWVSYFTTSGIAFHGTYWHNDYGVPRSHGCVNVTSTDAKWIWRWTMPPNDPVERYVHVKKANLGTTVVVE